MGDSMGVRVLTLGSAGVAELERGAAAPGGGGIAEALRVRAPVPDRHPGGRHGNAPAQLHQRHHHGVGEGGGYWGVVVRWRFFRTFPGIAMDPRS